MALNVSYNYTGKDKTTGKTITTTDKSKLNTNAGYVKRVDKVTTVKTTSSSSNTSSSSSSSSSKSSTPPLGKDSTGLSNPYVKGSSNYVALENKNKEAQAFNKEIEQVKLGNTKLEVIATPPPPAPTVTVSKSSSSSGKDSTGLSNPYVKGSENYLKQERANFNSLPGTSTPLTGGGESTLTVVDSETGKIIRQGIERKTPPEVDLLGGYGTAEARDKALLEYMASQPDAIPKKLTPDQEITLAKQLNNPTQTMYIRDFQPLPIPQSSVNIDEVKKALSKQRVNRTVEDSRLIEEAYSKSGADKVFVEQQRVLEAKNNLYNQAVYGQQKELVVDKNKIILPGQKGYYELGIDYQKTKTVDPKSKTEWQKYAFQAGQKIRELDVVGAGSLASYSFFTGVKETGDLVSSWGETIKKLSGYRETPGLEEPLIILPQKQYDYDTKGKGLFQFGGYLIGSAVSGLGSTPSLAGGLIRETPALLTHGISFGKSYLSEAVSTPVKTIGGSLTSGAVVASTLLESVYSKPISFTGEFIGGYSGFKLAGKVWKPVTLVGSNIKNVSLSKLSGIKQSFLYKAQHARLDGSIFQDVPKISYKNGLNIGFVDDIHINPVAGDVPLKKLISQGKLTQTRTFPEFESIKNLKTGQNVLAVQSPLGTRWGLPVRGQTYFQPFKDAYLSARQFGSENFQKSLQQYEKIKLSILPKTQKTYLFLGESKINIPPFVDLKKSGYSKKEIADLIKSFSSAKQGGQYNLAVENIIKRSTERQTALQSQGFLSSGQKVAGSNIKLIDQLPNARFYDTVNLPFGLSKVKPLQKAYEVSGIGRRWKVAEVFKVDLARPRGRPPILVDVGQRQRPTAIVQSGEKFLLVEERTGQLGLLGGARDPIFNPSYYAKTKIKQRGGRWILEDSIKAVQREAKEEIGFNLTGFKKAGVGVIKSKPYLANEGFLQQDIFNVFVAKGKKGLFDSSVPKGLASGEIKSIQYLTKEQILSMPNKRFTSGTKEIFDRYFGKKPLQPIEVKLSPREVVQTVKISDKAVESYVKYFAPVKYYSVAQGVTGVGISLGGNFNVREPVVKVKQLDNLNYSVPKDYVSKRYPLPDYYKYSSSYSGLYYPVEEVSTYTPKYSSKYSVPYSSGYIPPYEPQDTPPYKPPYTPPYNPPYTPPYNPPYKPPYTPPYKPPYPTYYKPPYTPPHTPPNRLRKKAYDLPQSGSGSKQKGYFSLVKKKGKWKKLDKTPRTFNAAWNKAATNADKTLSQSIKIIEANTPAVGREETLRLGKFKPSKRTLGVLVEKKKYALERDEIVEIKSAKKQKQGIGRFKLSL